MSEMSQTPDKFLPSLTMMYYAMIAGILIFAVMVVLMMGSQDKIFDFSNTVFLVAAAVAAIFCWLSSVLHSKLIEKIQQSNTLQQKMHKSMTAHIVSYFFLEIPALAGVVLFLVFSNWAFLLITVFVLFFFLKNNPNDETILDAMKLTFEERKLFK